MDEASDSIRSLAMIPRWPLLLLLVALALFALELCPSSGNDAAVSLDPLR